MFSREAANTNFIVFGLTWPWLTATIYYTWPEQDSQLRSTTPDLNRTHSYDLLHLTWPGLTATIYYTWPDQGSQPRSTTPDLTRAHSHDLLHLTWPGLTATIYYTKVMHANHCTTDAVLWSICSSSDLFVDNKIVVKTKSHVKTPLLVN